MNFSLTNKHICETQIATMTINIANVLTVAYYVIIIILFAYIAAIPRISPAITH